MGLTKTPTALPSASHALRSFTTELKVTPMTHVAITAGIQVLTTIPKNEQITPLSQIKNFFSVTTQGSSLSATIGTCQPKKT
jgi:hypothetical protein